MSKRQASIKEYKGFDTTTHQSNEPILEPDPNLHRQDAKVFRLLNEWFNLRQEIENITKKCPMKDMQYRESVVENILRLYHRDWVIHSVSNARGGQEGELPENMFDLKLYKDGKMFATVECKSGHVSSGNVTLSTSAGTFSDLPVKYEKYIQCDYYTYAVFFKNEILPALLVVVKPSGRAKHKKLLHAKMEALKKKVEEMKENDNFTGRYQQNGAIKVQEFQNFDKDDLEVYRYGHPWKTHAFMACLENKTCVLEKVREYSTVFHDFYMKHYGESDNDK